MWRRYSCRRKIDQDKLRLSNRTCLGWDRSVSLNILLRRVGLDFSEKRAEDYARLEKLLMNFPKFWAHAASGNFSAWRWSDTSPQDAQTSATEAARRLEAQFTQQGRPLDRYGYADRPLREPVLQELHDSAGDVSAVVTRNSYGCHILNATRAMFVDVDLPKAPKKDRIFASLFGHNSDPAQAVIAKAEDWARSQSGWNWRIYRTFAGLRLLATHALFDPAGGTCHAVFDAVGADPLYRKLCQTQECFRARLTPKPLRCEIGNPPERWPFPDRSSELAFSEWNVEYQSASQGKASCQLVSPGSGYMHPDLQSLVNLHDEMTRATSSLPLA